MNPVISIFNIKYLYVYTMYVYIQVIKTQCTFAVLFSGLISLSELLSSSEVTCNQ